MALQSSSPSAGSSRHSSTRPLAVHHSMAETSSPISAPAARVLRSELINGDVVELSGPSRERVTSPVRTVFDLTRTAESLADAVTFVDAMARNGVRPSDVAAYVAERRGWKGVPQVRRAAELARSEQVDWKSLGQEERRQFKRRIRENDKASGDHK